MIQQLLIQDLSLLPYIYEKRLSHGQVMLDSLTLAKEILETVLKSMSRTYFVIDGLDECEKVESKNILTWFSSLLEKTAAEHSNNIRGLFISQDTSDIKVNLSKFSASVLKLGDQDNKTDIELFATHWSSKIQQKFKLSNDVRQQIIHDVTTRAKGNYIKTAGGREQVPAYTVP
jgi:hypothetical protein